MLMCNFETSQKLAADELPVKTTVILKNCHVLKVEVILENGAAALTHAFFDNSAAIKSK